jgi:hypothetical protein
MRRLRFKAISAPKIPLHRQHMSLRVAINQPDDEALAAENCPTSTNTLATSSVRFDILP